MYGVLAYLLHIPCPIKTITGISCPGCGMSRALLSLATLDWKSVVHYHPLAFIFVPAVILLIIFHEKKMLKAKKFLITTFVIAFISLYLYRMVLVPTDVLEFAPQNGVFVRFWNTVFSKFS